MVCVCHVSWNHEVKTQFQLNCEIVFLGHDSTISNLELKSCFEHTISKFCVCGVCTLLCAAIISMKKIIYFHPNIKWRKGRKSLLILSIIILSQIKQESFCMGGCEKLKKLITKWKRLRYSFLWNYIYDGFLPSFKKNNFIFENFKRYQIRNFINLQLKKLHI